MQILFFPVLPVMLINLDCFDVSCRDVCLVLNIMELDGTCGAAMSI